MANPTDPISVAITGASGAQYGLRLVEVLLGSGIPVYLMVSKAAKVVIAIETDLQLPSSPKEMESALVQHFGVDPGLLKVFGQEQWTAPVASGSNAPQYMVVAPCSTGTLSAIATGASNNLIERAADVVLKEQRSLILMVRETPLSAIHLENMLKLAQLGVVIMPASPGFYHRPESVEDQVDFMVARVLDHLKVDNPLARRWGED